jgi:predicted PurR-regulated permease PerM
MLSDRKPYTFDRVFRIGITVALVWGLIWLLGYLSDVLIPFAVALILAYMMNPLVSMIQKKIQNRLAAVFLSLFIVIALAVFLTWLIIPMIVTEIKHTGQLLSNLVNNADLARHAAQRLPPDLWQAIKDYASRQEVQEFFKTENFWKIAEMAARKILPGVWGLIAGTASFIMGLVGLAVIGLYLIFLLLDYEKIFQEWKELLPPSHRETITGFVSDFESAMNRYFRGQAAVASIVGILLGLFIGLLNMVPYLQIIGLIPAVLLALVYALETGGSFLMILGLTGLVFIVVQIIQDAILVPKIMGRVTGLNPAMILLSLSIWGKLLGIFGLLIALPMTFLLLVYYRRFVVAPYTQIVQPPPTDH